MESKAQSFRNRFRQPPKGHSQRGKFASSLGPLGNVEVSRMEEISQEDANALPGSRPAGSGSGLDTLIFPKEGKNRLLNLNYFLRISPRFHPLSQFFFGKHSQYLFALVHASYKLIICLCQSLGWDPPVINDFGVTVATLYYDAFNNGFRKDQWCGAYKSGPKREIPPRPKGPPCWLIPPFPFPSVSEARLPPFWFNSNVPVLVLVLIMMFLIMFLFNFPTLIVRC